MQEPMINRRGDILLSSRIKRVLDYTEANYKISPSLVQASKTVGLTKSHFERIFKREVGLPYKKYSNTLKLFKAAETLRSHSGMSITDLCFDFNYGDLSYFIKNFKRHFGCPPKKFMDCKADPKFCCLRKKSHLFKLSGENLLIHTLFGKACYLDMMKIPKNSKNIPRTVI